MGFLFREKIETVLQETLFNPQSLLEQTVADTMSQVLVIRDDVLGRVKKIRTGGEGEDSITICEGQGIKQEEFLSDLRLDVMTVLLQVWAHQHKCFFKKAPAFNLQCNQALWRVESVHAPVWNY